MRTLAAVVGCSVLWLAAACVDSPECRIGAVRTCEECPTKEQTCGGEPVVWSPCNCPARFTGSPCVDDDDCGAAERCHQARTLLGGAPPGGMCAVDCAASAEVCPTGTSCVQTSGAGDSTDMDTFLCLETCALGGSGCPNYSSQVCTQRVSGFGCGDGACTTAGSSGLCRPLCISDGDCMESGGYCNRQTGACESDDLGGAPLGTECGEGTATTCEGLCLETAGAAFCTHSCIFRAEGVPAACDHDANDNATGYCALGESPSARTGDGAYCAPACENDDDCPANTRCQEFETAVEGPPGFCLPLAQTSPTDAGTPDAAADDSVVPDAMDAASTSATDASVLP